MHHSTAVLKCKSNLTLLNLQNTNSWSPGSWSKGRWAIFNSSVSFCICKQVKNPLLHFAEERQQDWHDRSRRISKHPASFVNWEFTLAQGCAMKQPFVLKDIGVISSSSEVMLRGTKRETLKDHQQCHGNEYSWHLFFPDFIDVQYFKMHIINWEMHQIPP